MIDRVIAYCNKQQMLTAGDVVVAGVSGGADSVCLFFVLCEMRKEIPFHLAVVYVNHGLREEAAKEADYVESLCRSAGVPFYLKKADVRARAKKEALSEEEAGRMIRYEAFSEVLQQEMAAAGIDEGNGDHASEDLPHGKIAVAHHQGDLAETMLFHLFRGTSLPGLCGIRPVSGNVIRPLLCLERAEIEAWLSDRGIRYYIDRTNLEDTYVRNRIRHHILPYAEESVCRGAAGHMAHTAAELCLIEDYLEKQTEEAMERCCIEAPAMSAGNEVAIQISLWKAEDPCLQGRMILSCLHTIAGKKKDLTAAHIAGVTALFCRSGNGSLDLPYGITVCKNYDVGLFYQKRDAVQVKESLAAWEEVQLPVPGSLFLPGFGRVESTCFPYDGSGNIPQKPYTKWFDYDKITTSVFVRTRQQGDYLTVDQALSKKSLQDYFVNEKIQKAERDRTPLLADGSHILWVIGHRISAYYKVTEQTRTVLQVTVSKDADQR